MANQPVEFFFYAESLSNAGSLGDALQRLGYAVGEIAPAARGERYCVTGWTQALSDDIREFDAWYEQMQDLAIEHGCEFDGYGRPVDMDDDDEEEDPEIMEFARYDFLTWLRYHGRLE